MPDRLLVEEATPDDCRETVELWQACGLTRPWNDPKKDFSFAIASPASTVLLGRWKDTIAASVMVGHDGHRGAVYYLGVTPALEGRGFGRAMMRAAEAWLCERDVWKLNLLVRDENRAVERFYERLGYRREATIQMSRRLEGKER